MGELLHDLLDSAAYASPARSAVRFRDRALTYKQMQLASIHLAHWLSDLGVGRDRRVVIALPVDVILPPLLYACSRVGAPFVVVSDLIPAIGLAHVLDDCEPVLLLSDRSDATALASERRIAHAGLDLIRAATADTSPESRLDGPLSVDPACLLYTSGSTGMPKAVVTLHSQACFATSAIQSQLEYRPEDVIYCALPLAFDYGLYQIFLSTLAGAELHLAPPSIGPELLVDLVRCRATILPAVPVLAANLLRLLTRDSAARPSLRLITNTGSAMPNGLLTQLRERLPGLQVQLMFGLTECKRAAIMPKNEDVYRPGACGRALPGTELHIISDRGVSLPSGEVGELVVRGPHVMAGYWRRPQLTAERFPRVGGLFPELRTGDYGWLDEDGYLHFVGRDDDIYKERGFRASTTEVEAAAHRVPGVEGAAVLPPRAGDAGATLFVASALAPHEVLQLLRLQLDGGKCPSSCVVLSELPLTANGKVDRGQMATLAQHFPASWRDLQ